MNTLHLPAEDRSGKLTPIVIAAMARGAKSKHHSTDPRFLVLYNVTDDDAAWIKLTSPDPVVWIANTKGGAE